MAARTDAVADLPCGTEKIARLYFHNDVILFMCSGLVILECLQSEFVDLSFGWCVDLD